MRLIDADKLLAEIKVLPIMSNWGESFLPQLVQKQPTVDAVPVVRCKSCKHSYDELGGLTCSYGVCVDCVVSPDFSCSYGERRDEC